jgi:hypothetical protein
MFLRNVHLYSCTNFYSLPFIVNTGFLSTVTTDSSASHPLYAVGTPFLSFSAADFSYKVAYVELTVSNAYWA